MSGCPKIDKARADAIRDAAKANYGWALPVFVREIMRQGLHNDPDRLRQLITDYATRLSDADTPAAARAAQSFGVFWLTGEIMKAAGLAAPDANVEAVIRWAWSSYVNSGEAGMLDPRAKNVAIVETWLRSNISVHVFRRNGYDDDEAERQHREAWAWFDADTVYVRADKIESIPGVTIGQRELASALEDAELLVKPASSRKSNCWEKLPGHGKIPNYRLKLALDAVEDDEGQNSRHRGPVPGEGESPDEFFVRLEQTFTAFARRRR